MTDLFARLSTMVNIPSDETSMEREIPIMPPECVILMVHLSAGAGEVGVGSGMGGWLGSGVEDGAQLEISRLESNTNKRTV